MRFAYIDSQGNEVSIPSIDALALRVELGAIGPDTQLYDAQADRWGPAHTHEIFHTLSRDAAVDGNFVAPPPKRFDVHEDLGLAAPEAEEPEEPEESQAPVEPAEPDYLDVEYTLTDALGPPIPAEEAPVDVSADMGLTFSEPPSDPQPSDPQASDPQAEIPAEDADAFNFGDWSTLEEADTWDDDEPPPVVLDDASGVVDFDGGLHFEEVMSDLSSGGLPAWMGDSAPETTSEEEPRLFSADLDVPDAGPPARRSPHGHGQRNGPAEGRRPRSRPSSPRRIRRTSPTVVIAGVIGLVVLGGGGYFAYTILGQFYGGQAADASAALPPVTIPEIPSALLPQMRRMGGAALNDMIDSLNHERQRSDLPPEPNRDWLAGVYLANASRYGDIQKYWEGFGSFVDHVRGSDTKVFHDRYVAQLASAGVAGDTASMLLARADSGFLAKRADRAAVYAQMGDLVDAALDLHRFLLLHEADIQYAPAAAGISEDPVLEAVPATKELGVEMWDKVDRITSVLDALGALDRVTSERLSKVLFDRIGNAGFQ